MDVGIDEEGNKHYHNFMMDKKTGLLGGPLVAYMQVRLNKTGIRFYNNESDLVEKEKWFLNGQYPKNMQDVCDVIKSATFDQVLKRSPGRAVAYIASYIHFPASTSASRHGVTSPFILTFFSKALPICGWGQSLSLTLFFLILPSGRCDLTLRVL